MDKLGKRATLRRIKKMVRSFVRPGIGVHVSRSCVFEHNGNLEAGYGWNWFRGYRVQVFEGKAVSQGIEVQHVESGRLAGDVWETLVDYQPDWLKRGRLE